MKLSRELKTGLVAITAIVLFIWGYNFMKGKNLLDGKTPIYYTEYSGLDGLNNSSKVTLKGVEIGRVQSTELKTENNTLKVLVSFTVTNKEIHFSKNSKVVLKTALMGGQSLSIVPGDGEKAITGDVLPGKIEGGMFTEVGSRLDPLQKKLADVLIVSDSLIHGLNDILDTKTRNSIKHSISEFDKTMTQFKGISSNVNTVVEENKIAIQETLNNSKEAANNVTILTQKLNTELENAQIAKTVQELKVTLAGVNGIIEGLNQGEGSLGKLLKDEQMYTNLTKASKELEELLVEVEANPKRFIHFSIFGKKDKDGDADDE